MRRQSSISLLSTVLAVYLLCLLRADLAQGEFYIKVRYSELDSGDINDNANFKDFSDKTLFTIRRFALLSRNDIVGHLFLPTPVNACSYIEPPPGGFPTNTTWIALVYDYPSCPRDMVMNIRNAGYKLIIASSRNDSHQIVSKEVVDAVFPVVIVKEKYANYLKEYATSNSTDDPILVFVQGYYTHEIFALVFPTSFVLNLVLGFGSACFCLWIGVLCDHRCGFNKHCREINNWRQNFASDTSIRVIGMDDFTNKQEDQGDSDGSAALDESMSVQDSEESNSELKCLLGNYTPSEPFNLEDFKETALKTFTYVDKASALQLLSRFPNGVTTCNKRYQYFGIFLLHCACWNGWYDVVNTLVESYDCCDPKINLYKPHSCGIIVTVIVDAFLSSVRCFSFDEQTPHKYKYHTSTRMGSQLFTKDLLESLDNSDGTAIHCACKAGHLDIVKCLIKKGCDPACRNVLGATPLHFACWEGHLDIVRFLVDEKDCNPACAAAGLTPLHLACWKGHLDTVKFLVENKSYSAYMKKAGRKFSPLHYACQKGKLDVVKLLVELGSDPASRDCKGYTPLHIACEYGHLDIVIFLVKEQHCNHLQQLGNWSTVTPLGLANSHHHHHVSSFLTSPGVSRQARYEYRYLSRNLFPPIFKVFVMGNHSVGKSTLVKAIQNRLTNTKWFGSCTDRFKRVSGVERNTAGIIPISIDSKRLGNIIMYDLAGQYEYYSSHAALLEKLVAYPGSLLMVVVDLSKDKNEIIQQLQYWNSFIKSHCSQSGSKPDVVIVGSHADVVKSQLENPKDKSTDILKTVSSSLQMHKPQDLEIIPLNCTQLASSGLNEVCTVIGNYCSQFRQEVSTDIRLNFLHAFLCQDFKGVTACKVSEIVSKISMEEWDAETVSQYLTTISDKSHFLYLRNDQDVSDSWMILDQTVLLSEVNGTVFAPKIFKEYHDISNSTGIVSFSRIKERFPDHDTEMIVSFMSHLEFCHQIAESEAALIHKGQPGNTEQEFEKLYFFPALVTEDRPEESCVSIAQSHYKCGWSLQCTQSSQFLSPRFLPVLLLRLAFSFALDPEKKEDEACPVLQRRSNVWKNGIHWQNRDGAEAIVEVVEQNTAVTVVIGCLKERELACTRLRSEVIRTILEVKNRFCGAVELRESLINPAELSSYPLKSPKILPSFTITELATAIAEDKPVVTNKQGHEPTMLKISELFYFEPYTCFDSVCLAEIFKDENSDKIDPSMLYTHSNIICQILSEPSPTYKALRSALDKYSVFCGRNPLLLAGQTCQSPKTSASSASRATLQPTDNQEYLTMSKKFAGITRALAANKLSESLADELKAHGMIGETVYAHATNHGPDVTEYTRMKHLITAILTSTKSNPQRYYDFITVLQMDGIREDAEAALALLPTAMPQYVQSSDTMETTFTEAVGPTTMQVYESPPPPSKATLSHELSNTIPLRAKPTPTRKPHGQESATDGSSIKHKPTGESHDREATAWDLSTIPHRTDRPHLGELQYLQGRGGRRVKVIEGVAAGWEELAKALHFDSSVIEHMRDTEDACWDILRRWLEGETRQPVNWGTLIDSLFEAGFVAIATDLQEAVEDYPIDVVCRP